jgi:DNA polymerase elongation subunit (family B)
MKKKVIFDGVKYVVGVGGLHSEDKGDLFESTDKVNYIDCDIGSFYPNMIVKNNICPAHLGDAFIRKYKETMEERVAAKKKAKDKSLPQEDRDKYKTMADTLKIVINSSFGKMGYEHHWLYDPLAMLKVTINGQLYLLMLIEQLVLNHFKVISANTDGVITEVPVNREEEYKRICSNFEEATKFELEYTYYKKYARSSVNDYIGITREGEVKTKGDFNVPDVKNIHNDTFMLRRGFDRPIIAIALNEFFKNDTPIRDTILNHDDIYDYCTAKKTDKKFKNEFHHVVDGKACINNLQQSVRYYVSTNGGSLYKKDKETGKMISYCVDKRVTIFNDYVESDDYKIDYNYYIHETQKIIDQIIKLQLTLF